MQVTAPATCDRAETRSTTCRLIECEFCRLISRDALSILETAVVKVNDSKVVDDLFACIGSEVVLSTIEVGQNSDASKLHQSSRNRQPRYICLNSQPMSHCLIKNKQ